MSAALVVSQLLDAKIPDVGHACVLPCSTSIGWHGHSTNDIDHCHHRRGRLLHPQKAQTDQTKKSIAHHTYKRGIKDAHREHHPWFHIYNATPPYLVSLRLMAATAKKKNQN